MHLLVEWEKTMQREYKFGKAVEEAYNKLPKALMEVDTPTLEEFDEYW